MKNFKKLGINIIENYGKIICTCDKIEGAKIQLDFPSVGATENIMLASVFAEGETTILNAAMEPEIVDLQNFLNRMGAKISGAGTNIIRIIGVKRLKEISYNIMPDRIEAGTMLCMGAVTQGKIELHNAEESHIEQVIQKLREAGCQIITEKNIIYLQAPKKLKALDIKTMPYPGFPTDMQSIMVGMLTVAKGTSIITENIFENRFKYTQELNRLGANIMVEGKTAIVKGKRRLYGATVKATDLRGGASLVLAGMVAKGVTNVKDIKYVQRGYERLEEKLSNLGAKIYVKEGE